MNSDILVKNRNELLFGTDLADAIDSLLGKVKCQNH